MSNAVGPIGLRRSALAGLSLLLTASLVVGGCAAAVAARAPCPARLSPGKAVTATAPAATGRPRPAGPCRAPTWRNPRDVASTITSANVSKLGVAWTVPLPFPAHTAGAYASTPVIVNGVVYVQDLHSDVLAISLATGPSSGRTPITRPTAARTASPSPAGSSTRPRTTPRWPWTRRPAAAVEPDPDPERPRGHRHGPGLRPRHRLRVHRAGQPDRGRVPRRRQGHLWR